MVIQRKQSVFLLLAAIMMGIFCFMPIASFMVDEMYVLIEPINNPVYLVVNILITLLLLLDIFLFKNFKLQKRVAVISIILIILSCVMWIMSGSNNFENFDVDWCYSSAILPLCSLILTNMALRGIKADEEKIKSYDRIR